MSTPEPRQRNRFAWALVIASALLVVGGTVVFVLDAVKERVTPENYERIKNGMTEREVETVLGRRADFRYPSVDFEGGDYQLRKMWFAERLAVTVYFREDGMTVMGKESLEGKEVEIYRDMFSVSAPTVWEKIRMRFGWKRPVVNHPTFLDLVPSR